MSERRVLLDSAAFVDSPHALAIDGARTADIREIVQRFLTACYEDVGKAPRLLEGDDLETLLGAVLPRYFGVKDPLAAATEEVLEKYLAFLDETEVVPAAYDLRRALATGASSFCDAVASGIAHRDGVAVIRQGKTVVHQAEKTGRNDPCPCGSGKKFKKCCMRLG